ncbi:hypothetical protein RD792_007808 [Penstemon davidsonii]|uniref:peroxidase n=1 Tax=Penstemon davidsonii TaxID=160366 RepID=A0ABR0D7E6_9LAMI|nr:hypothetical protein RD792_007808 [Penstemon davidsonii]
MLWSLVILISVCSPRVIINALSLNHYEKTSPSVDDVITKVFKDAIAKDRTVPAAVLRLHFHDCFIRSDKNGDDEVLLPFSSPPLWRHFTRRHSGRDQNGGGTSPPPFWSRSEHRQHYAAVDPNQNGVMLHR